MTEITADIFRKEIFDHTKSDHWKYEGKKPAIIYFYLDYEDCCMKSEEQVYISRTNVIMQELIKKYGDRLIYYKLNCKSFKKGTELAEVFHIMRNSWPSLAVIPMIGPVKIINGLVPRSVLHELIDNILKEGK